jgi:DNA helicase-2/ATP-dependent DNA helicase PcrA
MKIVRANKDENMRIIACAGSGKTTTIISRVRYLLQKERVSPFSILITTFNVLASTALIKKSKDHIPSCF